MGRVPSSSNRVRCCCEQSFDLRQFPSTEQTHWISAITLPAVERAFAPIGVARLFTVMQPAAVKIQQQAPAFNIDGNQPGRGGRLAYFKNEHLKRRVTQTLTNFASG